MNSNGKIGLDDAGIRASPGSERTKRTPLVEPAESGMMVISRSKGLGSAYERRSKSKKISVLLVCAAAIIIVSAVAVAALGNGTQRWLGHGEAGIPPPPFLIYGWTYDSVAAIVPFAHLNITEVTLGGYDNTVVSGWDGNYTFDLSSLANGYTAGDTVRVEANTTTMNGSVEFVIPASPPYLQVDVTLTGGTIPEFTDVAIPIAGIVSIFAVARIASSRKEEK